MKELPKAYEPKDVEKKWSKFWAEKEVFKAEAKSDKPPYCIVIPPPNVTGVLHMGHALVNTLQDILIRYKRMQGFNALWVPGTDHAGIATQTVVEKNLIASEGKRRKDYKREEFLEHVWAWKEKSEKTILNQIKRLGCSCDFSRLAFTMDEERTLAVQSAFKKMFDDGLIYRGNYLVNWDTVTQTALADDEVEHEEVESHLWHFRYPILGEERYLVIATTRPETMLGDTAVAVHPKDERYKDLVGKKIQLPITGREIPIIADDYVDPEFGTGCVKITPAHDPNDYEMGFRHNLEMINIMTPDGHINEVGGEFADLSMSAARKAVIKKMEELGLLEKIEPHTHRIGKSYRSKAVIEPYLSKQWFVKMSAFQKKLQDAVRGEKVKLIPKHWEKTYFHWIDNLRDWCISRQLWWGHQIPIWYNKENPETMICHVGKELPEEVKKNPDLWRQEEDVLDTWFSSALWPFATLGWPHKTDDLATFYPNSVLVTGHDILFFWVARMILMGEYCMKEVPFPETFLHGLIYSKSYWRTDDHGHPHYLPQSERIEYDLGKAPPKDVESKWEKMSKSKGNVIDPLEIIDMYGTDALRMTLCASATHARQIDLDRRRFEEYKNFANKVWNGARFVLMNLANLEKQEPIDPSLLTLEDKWLLTSLGDVIQEVEAAIDGYAFDKLATRSYAFFWDEFCAKYVEIVKPILFGKRGTAAERKNKQQILLLALSKLIRLLHPITPFITEEIYSMLKEQFDFAAPCCATSAFPKAPPFQFAGVQEEFSLIYEGITAVRNIRGEMQIPPQVRSDLHITGEKASFFKENEGLIQALVPIEKISYEEIPDLTMSAHATISHTKFAVPLPEELRAKEKARLLKEREKLEAKQRSMNAQLSNKEFVERAPEALVAKTRANIEEVESALKSLMQKIERL